jgi:hypothetical protein
LRQENIEITSLWFSITLTLPESTLVAVGAINPNRNRDRYRNQKDILGARGYCVKDDSAHYGTADIDPDPDSDFDPDEIKPQPSDALDAHSSRQ